MNAFEKYREHRKRKTRRKIIRYIISYLGSFFLPVILIVVITVTLVAAIEGIMLKGKNFIRELFTTETQKELRYRVLNQPFSTLSAKDLLYAFDNMDLQEEQKEEYAEYFTQNAVSYDDFIMLLKVAEQYEPDTFASQIRLYRTVTKRMSYADYVRLVESAYRLARQDMTQEQEDAYQEYQKDLENAKARKNAEDFQKALQGMSETCEAALDHALGRAYLHDVLGLSLEDAGMASFEGSIQVEERLATMDGLEDATKQSVTLTMQVEMEASTSSITTYNYYLDYGFTWRSVYALALDKAMGSRKESDEVETEEETSSGEIQETEASKEEHPALYDLEKKDVKAIAKALLGTQTVVEIENNDCAGVIGYMTAQGFGTLAKRAEQIFPSDMIEVMPHREVTEGETDQDKGRHVWMEPTSVAETVSTAAGTITNVIDADEVNRFEVEGDYGNFLDICAELTGREHYNDDLFFLYLHAIPGGDREAETLKKYKDASGNGKRTYEYEAPIYLATEAMTNDLDTEGGEEGGDTPPDGNSGGIIYSNGENYVLNGVVTNATVINLSGNTLAAANYCVNTMNFVQLSSADVASIMSQLSPNLSAARRNIIAHALSYVGKIRYSQGTTDNVVSEFGGRAENYVLEFPRYLDCSAFIHWAYAYHNYMSVPAYTGDLADQANIESGNFSALRAGDVAVKIDGGRNHAVMFLGWLPNGVALTLEEMGTGEGNR